MEPQLSIIVLNYNRVCLLRSTVWSLLHNTDSRNEIFVVDNASTDASPHWISIFSRYYDNVTPILLKKNRGGEAINEGIKRCSGKYVLITENDLEYLPHWDTHMLKYFREFPEIGAVSPFSPFPQKEIGEVWEEKPHEEIRKGNITIYPAMQNLGTTSLVRREILEKVRFHNLYSSDSEFIFPDDGRFSQDIRALGYGLAWSDKYYAINWGHNQHIWEEEKNYYRRNWNSKAEIGIDGLSIPNEKEALAAGELVHKVGILEQKLHNAESERDDLKKIIQDTMDTSTRSAMLRQQNTIRHLQEHLASIQSSTAYRLLQKIASVTGMLKRKMRR